MRIVLVEDQLAALRDPDDALCGLVPDLPELGALALVGAADFACFLVDLVLGLLIFVAAVLAETACGPRRASGSWPRPPMSPHASCG